MMNSLLTLKEQRRVVNIELVVPDSTARRRHGRDTIPVPIFTITIRALVFLDPHKSVSGVINKTTTLSCVYHLYTDDLLSISSSVFAKMKRNEKKVRRFNYPLVVRNYTKACKEFVSWAVQLSPQSGCS